MKNILQPLNTNIMTSVDKPAWPYLSEISTISLRSQIRTLMGNRTMPSIKSLVDHNIWQK